MPDIFDNIDETAESSIIEFIKVVNLDIYREITSQRVSFSAINQLDERLLRQIVKDISCDEMAIALKSALTEITERFFSVLPSKSRIILEDRLASMKNVSLDDELKVRRRIARMVRSYLKSGGATLAAASAALELAGRHRKRRFSELYAASQMRKAPRERCFFFFI